jgi:hypothetical protein
MDPVTFNEFIAGLATVIVITIIADGAVVLLILIERTRAKNLPTAIQISQVLGANMASGITPGGSGLFQATLTPAGSGFPAGSPAPTYAWSSDDSNVSFAPSPDGDPTKIQASVPASDTQGSAPTGQPPSVNISVTVSHPSLSAPLVGGPFNVLLNSVAPPPPPLPTGVTIAQVG